MTPHQDLAVRFFNSLHYASTSEVYRVYSCVLAGVYSPDACNVTRNVQFFYQTLGVSHRPAGKFAQSNAHFSKGLEIVDGARSWRMRRDRNSQKASSKPLLCSDLFLFELCN